MGRINEYQRKQLVSSATGVASEDRSGQIIGGTVAKFGAQISAQAQKLDMYDETQANVAVMQFGLSFQKFNAQAQREMANNPGAYPDRVLAGGQELLTDFANGIPDEGVRGKFLSNANTILKANVLQANSWAQEKKKDNATIAAKDIIRLGTVSLGETYTKEQLMAGLSTIDELVTQEIPDDILSGKEKQDFIDKNMPGALESHFANRISQDAEQLVKDLNAGEYKDVPFYTDAMKVKYRKQAETKIRQNEARVKEAQTDNFQQLMDEYIQGQLSFSMVDAMATAEQEEEGISQAQATKLKTLLIKQVRADATLLEKSTPAATQYIDLIHSVFDNRVENAKALESIVEVYADGIVSREESAFLSETRATLRETRTSRRSEGVTKGLETITNKIDKAWREKDLNILKKATAFQDLVAGVAAGIAPEVAARQVLKAIDRDKVISENNSLAGYDNPVEEAYRIKAVEVLKANGYPVDKANVDALMAQFKEADDRADKK